MRVALLSADGATVINVIEAPDDWTGPGVEVAASVAPGDLHASGVFSRPPPETPANPTSEQLRARARFLRDEARAVSAVTLTGDEGAFTVTVDSAAGDIAMLNGIALSIAGLPDPFRFKGGGAFFDLSHAQFAALYPQVGARLQAAYAAEDAVVAGVEAGAILTLAALDAAFIAALE